MTPVISPWVFYFMQVSEDVAFFSKVLGGFSLTALCGFALAYVLSKHDSYCNEDLVKSLNHIWKSLIPITIVLLLTASLLPTERTITKMLIAQNVTYERVEVATDTVETVYNDIMNLFEEADNDD